MKLFKCSHCGQPSFFENNICVRCSHALGFSSEKIDLLTLIATENGNFADIKNRRDRYRYCSDAQHGTCNWLLNANDAGIYCIACQLNHTIPNLSNPEHIALWKKLEIAKHALTYALLKLNLPLVPKSIESDHGLAFDFLSEDNSEDVIVMGHENGLITINLNEADEAKRVALREKLNEPYRTILGHFRHEIGHYYWDRLVETSDSNLNEFRRLFGDERIDYTEALQQYYENGPAANWSSTFISGYATSHPWEDWAETWSHYLHVMDALENAWSFGLAINPSGISKGEKMRAEFDHDPYLMKDFQKLIDLWFPLTIALNSMNRSIGQPDFYPFVMPKPVIEKMKFIHTVCLAYR